MPMTTAPHDVVIMGGGLAGLTLALQLKQRDPALQVLVLERRAHPVPEAAHKVGESSVEIGAHYFSEVLGLREHLDRAQLRKFGFRFFFCEGRRDIDQVTEIGASRFLAVPSYQIDRGIFENFLGQEARRRGVEFVDSAIVRSVDLATDGSPHALRFEAGGTEQSVQATWLVDACGRAGLLKRKLDLAQPNAHDAHAVWFRIKGRIDIDRWVDNPTWRARCEPQARWLSTNHLVGAGYWVWLIPLASGSHSVGIVADPRWHPLERMNTFDKAMDWLARYQPRLHDDLDGRRDQLQDFAYFRNFSYGCKQVFSAQRWALTGEAGLFLDPFYSPGSDFIGISNTYITELVAMDRAGRPLGAHAQLYDQIYHSFYDSTLALYTDQYGLFGDPEVLPVKVIWDYSYYWGVLAQFFFQARLTDLAALGALKDELAQCQRLNLAVQGFLRDWSGVSAKRNAAVMLDQASLPWFAELNRSLNDRLDDAAFRARIRASTRQLRCLAAEMLARVRTEHPGLPVHGLQAVLDGVPSGTGGGADAGRLRLTQAQSRRQGSLRTAPPGTPTRRCASTRSTRGRRHDTDQDIGGAGRTEHARTRPEPASSHGAVPDRRQARGARGAQHGHPGRCAGELLRRTGRPGPGRVVAGARGAARRPAPGRWAGGRRAGARFAVAALAHALSVALDRFHAGRPAPGRRLVAIERRRTQRPGDRAGARDPAARRAGRGAAGRLAHLDALAAGPHPGRPARIAGGSRGPHHQAAPLAGRGADDAPRAAAAGRPVRFHDRNCVTLPT